MITDKDVIQEFFNDNGKLKSNKLHKKWLNNHIEYKKYLETRYEVFVGYSNTLKYIFVGREELKRCQNCGKVLPLPNRKWCSSKCQLTDPKFVAEREAKIDQAAKVEKFKNTCIKKYGVSAPAKNPEIAAKMAANHDYKKGSETCKQTCLCKYGVENVFQLESSKQKAKQTKLDKHGDAYYTNREQAEQTMLARHGVKSALCKGELRDKGLRTKEERYGNKHFTNPDKQKETKQRKYGDPNYNNPEKHQKTCIKRYGETSYSKTLEYVHKRRKKYLYKKETFDSAAELAVYKYCVDKRIKIEREPCRLEYEFAKKKHYYFPDFKIDGNLVEVKGSHFFENGKMINPFDRDLDELYEAKHQCMLKNNVVIITDCTKYLEYCGKKFIKKCLVR